MKALATQSLTLICSLIIVYGSSTAQTIAPATVAEPLPIEIANSAKLFAPISIDLAPDGLWVAYTLTDPRRRKVQGRPSDLLSVFNCSGAPQAFADHDLLLTNTQTGRTLNISSGKGANWGPSWSPDGKFLAFYSDRSGKAHVWIWERATGNLRPLKTAVVHVRLRSEKIVWTPDSHQVITKVLGPGQLLDECFTGITAELQPTRSPRVVYEAETPTGQPPASTDSFLADLAALDVTTGRLRRIVRQQKIVGYSLSPTGDKIAYAVPTRSKPTDQYVMLYDLTVTSLLDQRSETVHDFSPGGPSLPAGWSPDGRLLAYTSERQCFIWTVFNGQPRKVASVSRTGFAQQPLWNEQGGTIYLLGENKIWRVSVADAEAVPITTTWDRQVRSILTQAGGSQIWSTDKGHSLFVSTNNAQTKEDGFFKLDLRTGAFTKLIESDASFNVALSVVSRADDFIYAAQTAQREQNLWIARRGFSTTSQLTHVNPEVERYETGPARLIDYADADGKELQATLLLPATFQKDRRYPLIVWVYGGSLLSTGINRYGSTGNDHQNMQLLASRGYAVLLPDAPLRIGTPMQDLAKTVLPAVDKAIELGIADPERLGVMGLSYGGYSTLALIAQTTRFKAAAMDAGFGNVITSYGVMLKNGMPLGVGWAEEGQGRMGGPPWQFPERYVQNSPVFVLDKVQTPLLITQGGMDISPYQSEEIFVGLRRLGKKVVYVRYENEGHGIELFENRVDYWERLINWFGTHLNNKAASPASAH